ncbi:MAG: MraY family glycosyltransferase [Planctomycetota bacterium]
MSLFPLAVLVSSFVAALVLTPIVRSIAIAKGIIDKPDGRRKLHKRFVARAGGTAVIGAVFLVGAIGVAFYPMADVTPAQFWQFGSLLIAMLGIWALGMADDIWTLRGRQKLVGQIALSAVLAFSGVQMANISVFGFTVSLGVLAIPATIFWLVATTNSLNLIDGSDGVCSSLGAIICGALGILAFRNGDIADCVVAFAMCGALLGFLVFNFPPASIFLGDSGSLLIGFVTGALAIRCSLEGATAVMLAILSLPLMDSTMAIIRRRLTGRSIYATDRAHLHHSLRGKGFSDRGLLFVVSGLAMFTAVGAVIGAIYDQEWFAMAAVLGMFLLLVTTKAFGYSEMALIARRGKCFALSFLQRAKAKELSRAKAVRLQGTREWEVVWDDLIHFAESEEYSKLNLDLNVPWLEEGFHGEWQKGVQPDKGERWTVTMPIFGDGRVAGRIEVVAAARDDQAHSSLARLTKVIDRLHPQISNILSEGTLNPPVTLVAQDYELNDPGVIEEEKLPEVSVG